MNKQQYLLIKLIEECAEISQEASKALIFGLGDSWKDNPVNSEKLIQEMGDLMGVWRMLLDEAGMMNYTEKMISDKIIKVNKFMEYSKEKGILDKENAVKHAPLKVKIMEKKWIVSYYLNSDMCSISTIQMMANTAFGEIPQYTDDQCRKVIKIIHSVPVPVFKFGELTGWNKFTEIVNTKIKEYNEKNQV